MRPENDALFLSAILSKLLVLGEWIWCLKPLCYLNPVDSHSLLCSLEYLTMMLHQQLFRNDFYLESKMNFSKVL